MPIDDDLVLPECGHVDLVFHETGIVLQQVQLLQHLVHAARLYPAHGGGGGESLYL